MVDSFPIPLCKSVRNRITIVLSKIADIGYNSIKNQYFYRLKISVMVTKTGFPLTYTVIKESISDVDMVETLALDCPVEKLLGNKEYIGLNIQQRLLD